jgi:hypothetical protein
MLKGHRICPPASWMNPTVGETSTWLIVKGTVYKINHICEEVLIYGTVSEPFVSYIKPYFRGGEFVSLSEFIATVSLGLKSVSSDGL